MNIKDLTGKQFGNLTVLNCTGIGTHGKEYLCRCICGNTHIYRGSTLTSGVVVGCGCSIGRLNKGKYRPDNARQHIGETYNRLTIVDISPNNSRGYRFICKCTCGNITTQIYADLLNGKVKSCGCYGREQQSIVGSTYGLNNFKNLHHWYFIQDGIKIPCRSGYEVIFANYLNQQGIKFKYEPKTFRLSEGLRYTPDFYLISDNKYIELKGTFNNGHKVSQKVKIDIFSASHKIQVLFWEDIVSFCNLPFKSYQTYIRKAQRNGMSAEDYFAKFVCKTMDLS